MILPYSTGGRPMLPLSLALGRNSLQVEGLLDSGSDVNVLPFDLAGRWARNGTPARPRYALPARWPAHLPFHCCLWRMWGTSRQSGWPSPGARQMKCR